ncbi:MAG: glycosyltransferase N-terminal domain-containing protein [Mucilaginibacter sp.]
MLSVYNIGVRLYSFLVHRAAFFNQKAKQWVNGRKDQSLIRYESSIWFHFASLGEFEQGRPVLEQLRALHPGKKIVITFFSPSGYEVRKNTPLADAVYYLPLDTNANAAHFISAVNPEIAVFTKYEYWYHFFNQLHQKQVPLYIISGIFRADQVFFKWYGRLHRKMLGFVTHFFLQDENSKQLLENIGIKNTTVSGDTRFDRVWANAQQPAALPGIAEFIDGQQALICGSTWPEDEKLLASLVTEYPELKFIFAPHQISDEKINRLIDLLPDKGAVRYSRMDNNEGASQYRTLIIDNIGMLSSLYQYGHIAYIGGGFGVGIHNTLEAAAFGLPVIFGPNYAKFNEARELIALQAGFSVGNESELTAIMDKLITDSEFYKQSSKSAATYVEQNKGATGLILQKIKITGQPRSI